MDNLHLAQEVLALGNQVITIIRLLIVTFVFKATSKHIRWGLNLISIIMSCSVYDGTQF